MVIETDIFLRLDDDININFDKNTQNVVSFEQAFF